MTSIELIDRLKLHGKVLSIKRMEETAQDPVKQKGCALYALKKALEGETVFVSQDGLGCRGAAKGFGFSDEIPDIPGGAGHFLSYGGGEGAPPGERIKCSPELGERLFAIQPTHVMDGYKCIRVKPYEDEDDADTVTALATADQLSLLIHLFSFRKAILDEVYAPMVSGCASVFRLPFGEIEREAPRGVIGNVDLFARSGFDRGTFFFTITGKDFATVVRDAEESVLAAPIAKKVLQRL